MFASGPHVSRSLWEAKQLGGRWWGNLEFVRPSISPEKSSTSKVHFLKQEDVYLHVTHRCPLGKHVYGLGLKL